VNIHQISTAPASSHPIAATPPWRRWHLNGAARAIGLSLLGAAVAIIGPAYLCAHGWGMSRQQPDLIFDTATAASLAITCSLAVTHRLLAFPLLQSRSYVAITFATCFALVAVALKAREINYSSPQFFLGMVLMAAFVEGYYLYKRRFTQWHVAVVPGGLRPTALPSTLSMPIKLSYLHAVPASELPFGSVVADLSYNLDPAWERFLATAALRGIPVYNVKQFNELVCGRVFVDHLWENTLGANVPSLIYPQIKRLIDVMAALVLLPFIGLIVGVAALAIKWESPGPVLFRQSRIGMGGKPFRIVKLRTMKLATAITDGHAAYTKDADPRVTRVGRFLRRHRIDELPQVINILRGEMSWIGPRPEAVELSQWYEREVSFYVYRHIVRPGISGWAQVNQGNVAAVDAARRKLEYDFFYIKHFSFWIDAVIFIKSIRTILTCSGAR
jgi:lipopolysaccharide/colanic/teichoic acid biosynthesis glycosyltransferase